MASDWQKISEIAALKHKLRRAWADRKKLHLRVQVLTAALTAAGVPAPPEKPVPEISGCRNTSSPPLP